MGRVSEDRMRRIAPWAPGAVLAAGAIVCLWLNLPGQISYDSVLQLFQGRTGVYNAWHPPVMAWMLGLFDGAVRGTGLFVLFDVVLVFGALAAFALPAKRAPCLTTVVAALWVLTPQLVLYPGIVWKDVLFAAAFVAGFACLLWTARRWGNATERWALFTCALALLSLAALARQNGVVGPVFGALALGWIAWRSSDGRRLLSALAHGAAFLVASLAVVAGVSAALASRGDGEPSRAFQVEDLQIYDLAGALQARPNLTLPHLAAADPALDRYLRTIAAPLYSPVRVDKLEQLPELESSRAAHLKAVAAGWRDLVVRHPLLYLRLRARAFEWVTLTPDIRSCLPVYLGIDGPDPEFTALGLHHRADVREQALTAYVMPFIGTPVLLHLPYLILGLLLGAKLVKRRRTGDGVVAAMLAGAAVFAASFALISIACDYRYLYAADLTVMAAALYVAATSSLRFARG